MKIRLRVRRHAGADGRETAAGFTLIEMLVVLVITAAITAILLSAFERVLDIRVRLAAFLDGTDEPTLVAGWFRGSVDGLLPDAKGGDNVFVGAPRRFSGLTVAAIDGPPGVPAAIVWSVVYEADRGRTYLRYQAGTQSEWTIASWPGDSGALSYCEADLTCTGTWPLSQGAAPLGTVAAVTPPQLPAMIRLDAIKGNKPWPILAAPQAGRDPLPPPLKLGGPSS